VAGKQQQQQQVAGQELPPPLHQQQPQQQHPSMTCSVASPQHPADDATVLNSHEVQPQQAQPHESPGAAPHQLLQQSPQYTVTLDGVEVSYVINPASGHVTVLGAASAKVSG
jgi:hypothetical protein